MARAQRVRESAVAYPLPCLIPCPLLCPIPCLPLPCPALPVLPEPLPCSRTALSHLLDPFDRYWGGVSEDADDDLTQVHPEPCLPRPLSHRSPWLLTHLSLSLSLRPVLTHAGATPCPPHEPSLAHPIGSHPRITPRSTHSSLFPLSVPGAVRGGRRGRRVRSHRPRRPGRAPAAPRAVAQAPAVVVAVRARSPAARARRPRQPRQHRPPPGGHLFSPYLAPI